MHKIILEPASHPTDPAELERIFTETQNGDIDATVWNGNVKRRIKTYKPSVLAIDSVMPTMFDADGRVPASMKLSLLSGMPGRPSELNGTDKITVIATDNTYGTTDTGIIHGGLNLLSNVALVGGAAKVGAEAYTVMSKKVTKPADRPVYDQEAAADYRRSLERKSDRRNFVACGLASLMLAARYSPFFASYAPNESLKNIGSEIDNVLGEVSLSRLVDVNSYGTKVMGRTALMISKLDDILQTGTYGSLGSVVFGYGHLADAKELHASKDLCSEKIRDLTQYMIQYAKEDTHLFGRPSTWAERISWVMTQQRRIDIYTIHEPDAKRFKANPEREVDRIVEFVDTMYAPSASRAIADLPSDQTKA